MRLSILDKGHSFGTKALFAFIRLVTRHPTPEMIKLIGYRPDFFGVHIIKAHTAVAVRACGDEPKVAAVLSDLEAAPISEPLRATLRMLGKLTREQTVTADDMRSMLAAGVTPQQIEDALAVGFAFNTINRLAETFAFSIPGSKALDAGAKFLLAHGYR